ncbi:MAG: hypothetical protein H6Q30_1846 [Bacteroidetes bacterium]|nr:hypothetical protein [Bacteroidota bacterium]
MNFRHYLKSSNFRTLLKLPAWIFRPVLGKVPAIKSSTTGKGRKAV